MGGEQLFGRFRGILVQCSGLVIDLGHRSWIETDRFGKAALEAAGVVLGSSLSRGVFAAGVTGFGVIRQR